MHKTVNQDDELSDSDEENDKYQEPTLRYESVPHKGSINRIRSMYGSPIVATWNEDGELGIYNVSQPLAELDAPVIAGKKQQKNFGGSKLASWKHKSEGYALDWSPNTYGRLAAGNCSAELWLYQSADETGSTFVKET